VARTGPRSISISSRTIAAEKAGASLYEFEPVPHP
jgi:hypothetical protein